MKKKGMIIAVLVLSAFICSQSVFANGTQEGGEEVTTLKVYYLGPEGGPTASTAMDTLNELLEEKIGVRLDANSIAWGDWKQKLPMIMASGEDYDLVYTSSWAYYFTEGPKGAFMPLDDLLPAYAPTVYQMMVDSGADKYTRINGELFLVPTTNIDLNVHDYLYREDLRKKYNIPEINTLDDLANYCEVVKENNPSLLPMNMAVTQGDFLYNFLYDHDWSRPIVGGDTGVLVADLVNADECINYVETKDYEEFLNRQHEWYKKGFWSKSILSEKTLAREHFQAGNSVVAQLNYVHINDYYGKISMENPDWELKVASFDTNMIEKASPANNGMAVGINSQNPEKALEFLELCYTDPEIFNLIYYGIEGVNYELTADGKVKRPDSAKASDDLSVSNLWIGIRADDFMRPEADDWDFVTQRVNELEDRGVFSSLASFVLDPTEIAAEIAAINNVCIEYKLPLDWGTVDPAEGLSVLKQKLKDAGIDVVMEEINRQIKAYRNDG